MQKLIELEEKINYLITIQQPQIQQPQIQQPQIQQPQFNQPQIYQPQIQQPQFNQPQFNQSQFNQPQRMPDFQYKERMFPTGVEPQRFGVITRGGGKQS
jgi:hypothetical protein